MNEYQSEKKTHYTLIKQNMTKDMILEKYGKVSYAYKELGNGILYILAISNEEPQYLKTYLMIDKEQNFFSVDTFIENSYLDSIGDVV